jgi:UDP-N-acetylglucosamine--N-acetylmuramyl-(pentapeptide) pyrophosphoryl-undecaprenol N-acetylglucosamine transferase
MQSSRKTRFKGVNIVVMAGGTGGHVFPALAVARALEQEGATISWLGTEIGIEAEVVPSEFPIDYIDIKGIRKKSKLVKLMFPLQLLKAIAQSFALLRKRQINLVIGFGGYASGPGALAARLMFKPVLIHEQNAKAGMTNRYLAKMAKHIMCAFPSSDFSQKKTTVVGNPIRSKILAVGHQSRDFNQLKLNVLVLGGSLGAQILNDVVPKAVALIPELARPNVWHQSGGKLFDNAQKNYDFSGVTAEVMPFIKKISEAYAWADVVICRSGASTVSEVAAVGLPAIFVPYPHAVDDHQFHNAQVLVRAKAASCIRQENFSPERLSAFIRAWDLDRAALSEQSLHAKGVAVTDSVEKVLNIINEAI